MARQEVEAHHTKWVKRGGRNLKYWSTLYAKSGKGQASSSSSSGAVWIPNPKGKGRSNDDGTLGEGPRLENRKAAAAMTTI